MDHRAAAMLIKVPRAGGARTSAGLARGPRATAEHLRLVELSRTKRQTPRWPESDSNVSGLAHCFCLSSLVVAWPIAALTSEAPTGSVLAARRPN